MSQWLPLTQFTSTLPIRGFQSVRRWESGVIQSDLISPYSSQAFIGMMKQGEKSVRAEVRISRLEASEPPILFLALHESTENMSDGEIYRKQAWLTKISGGQLFSLGHRLP